MKIRVLQLQTRTFVLPFYNLFTVTNIYAWFLLGQTPDVLALQVVDSLISLLGCWGGMNPRCHITVVHDIHLSDDGVAPF